MRKGYRLLSDAADLTLDSEWKALGFNIHIITESGGNRKANIGEIEAVCKGDSDTKLAIYPQSAGCDCIDIDRGGLEALQAVSRQLSSYTKCDFLAVPSKTRDRYHLWIPVTGSRETGENTSPKWMLEAGGGEIKGGTSRITLYHPVIVLNWLVSIHMLEDRVPPSVVRAELCPASGSHRETKEGSYRTFIKRDLSSHENVLNAYLAIYEAGKRGELDANQVETLAEEIETKSSRNAQEIARAKKDAQVFVEKATGPETEELGKENRPVRTPDIDMAVFMRSKFGDVIRHIRESDKYLCWISEGKISRAKGANWQERDVLSDISKIIAERWGTNDKERHYYGSANRAKAVESLLKGQVDSSVEDFDSKAYWIGVPGEDYDLKAAAGSPSDYRMMVTKRTLVKPDFSMETPLWDKFTLETFGASTAAYMQRYIGYSLTGTVREAKVLFLCGEGGSGKTTYANVVRRVFGDYATSIAKKVLFPGRHSSDIHLTFVAQLQGKRVAIVPEIDSYDRLNDSLFKSLSGNDEITANFMRRDPFTFTNTAKLFVLSNPKPKLNGFDSGIRRRLVIIPCDNKPAKIDTMLEAKLMMEAPGILAKWITECKRYCADGLLELPEDVDRVTERHIASQDLFGNFVNERLEFHPDGKLPSKMLLDEYRKYLHESNELWAFQHFTLRDISNEMKRYDIKGVSGPKDMKLGRIVAKGYRGVRIKAGPSPEPL